MITLSGVSWDHPRGHDPMVATAEAYMQCHSDVRIFWETRRLKEFGDFQIERMDLSVSQMGGLRPPRAAGFAGKTGGAPRSNRPDGSIDCRRMRRPSA